MSFDLFKKYYLQSIHLKIIYKKDLALNNHQEFKPNNLTLYLNPKEKIVFTLMSMFYLILKTKCAFESYCFGKKAYQIFMRYFPALFHRRGINHGNFRKMHF